ncbi:MAG TPA: hypothetical protein VNG71_16655 [Pyrinomonadaceae bacterium]|nr:hypothetical protein [Pyrinomonadaceae bacterium]
MRSTTQTGLSLLAAMLIGMGTVPLAKAQVPTAAERRKACERAEGTERKWCEHGYSMPGSGLPPANTADEPPWDESESGRAQLTDDLNYLKAAAAYLARAFQSEELDLKAIGVETEEIRKRAKRLRDGLGLPPSEPTDVMRELELANDRPQLKLSIYALSALITDAVQRPLPTGRVLFVVESLKARKDLDAIVELSRRISMQCELFSKSGRL